MHHTDRGDRNPAVAELLEDAYVAPIDVETAARHLWVIHSEADRLAREVRADERDPRELVGAGAGPDRGRRALPRAAAPLLVLVLMLSSSGVALAASQGSLPGDVLYPVKRGTEQAQLIFTRNPEARAQLQLAFARNRLDELRRLGDSRPEHLAALVADISESLSEVEASAPEAAPVSAQIRQQTSEQIAQLGLPREVTQAVDQAMTATPDPTANAAAVTDPDPSRPATTPSEGQVPASGEPGGAASSTTASSTASTDPTTVTESALPTTNPPATATPTPSIGPSAAPAQPTAATSPSSGPSSTPSGSPSPSATPSPSPSATPSVTEGGSNGPVVTSRPHPADDGGSSRSDDGSESPGETGSEPPADAPPADAGAGDEAAPGEDVRPYTRPE